MKAKILLTLTVSAVTSMATDKLYTVEELTALTYAATTQSVMTVRSSSLPRAELPVEVKLPKMRVLVNTNFFLVHPEVNSNAVVAAAINAHKTQRGIQ